MLPSPIVPKMPRMSQTPAEDDDYELEPPDEDVTRNQQQRAREELAKAQKAIDVDKVYRELDRGPDVGALYETARARFSLRSILIATTAVAVVLGLAGSGLFNGGVMAVFIVLVLIGLGAAHGWLNYQEHQRQQAAIAHRKAELREARRGVGVEPEEDDDDEEEPTKPPTPAELGLALLRMSPVEWVGAIVIGLVTTGLLAFAPSLAAAIGSMGAAAIIGMALIAADVAVPRLLVVAWCLALVGLVVVSFVGLLV